jgi:hypothetical protein
MPSRPMEKNCAECGRSWVTRSPRARTCSPRCRAILREREHPSPGRPERDYGPEIVAQITGLYEAGLTIREIGALTPPGVKVQLVVERYLDERHPTGPRDQTGERNGTWKGDEAGYNALHLRVITARGRPSRCACCDTTDPAIRYHWANLSGHYEDIYDYARLCPACHIRLDARRRAEIGRNTMPVQGGG